MINIYDKATGAACGAITEAQLQFLIGQFEEESAADTDYYIDQVTVDMLKANGADAGLVALLRKTLGDREDMEIRWSRE
jgi:processive 1,2-diacylglycerol beta-glucosyltransferase